MLQVKKKLDSAEKHSDSWFEWKKILNSREYLVNYNTKRGGSPHGVIVLFDYGTLHSHDFQSRPHSFEMQPNDPPYLLRI